MSVTSLLEWRFRQQGSQDDADRLGRRATFRARYSAEKGKRKSARIFRELSLRPRVSPVVLRYWAVELCPDFITKIQFLCTER